MKGGSGRVNRYIYTHTYIYLGGTVRTQSFFVRREPVRYGQRVRNRTGRDDGSIPIDGDIVIIIFFLIYLVRRGVGGSDGGSTSHVIEIRG